jgi:hypothetical protein
MMRLKYLQIWIRAAMSLCLGTAIHGQAQLRISEILTSGNQSIEDEDGDHVDWIEIYNVGGGTVQVGGWALTQDSTPAHTLRWVIPDTLLPDNAYLIVFASGKNRRVSGAPLHTDFKLDNGGEYLALLRPDGTVAWEFNPTYGTQADNISYGNRLDYRILTSTGSVARILVPTGPIPDTWRSDVNFNDQSWLSGELGIGFPAMRPRPVIPLSTGFTMERVAYQVPRGTVGIQDNFGGNLGLDFNVNSPVTVTELGVFDSGANGLSRPLTAQLWSRGAGGPVLITSLAFTTASPGELIGGSRFKKLATPVYLAPGPYAICAYGYGTGEPNGNALSPTWTTDAAPQISYVGGGRFGDPANPSAWPAVVDGGPANRYAAGTFLFNAAITKTAYVVPAATVGTQPDFGGSLGMDFDVTENVLVTRLGVFDSGSDGLQRTITAEIWSRNEQGTPGNPSDDTAGTRLGVLTFTPADSGQLVGGSRFKSLATPLLLAPGAYTINAYGYGAGEPNGNGAPGPRPWSTGDDSRIRFVGTGRFGAGGSTGFPALPDGGPANRYAAGTFEFLATSTPADNFTGVANPSFEQASVTLGDNGFISGSVLAWTLTGGGGTFNPDNTSYPGATDQTPDLDTTVPDGKYVAYLGFPGKLSQELTLKLGPYTTYTLRVSGGERLTVGKLRYALRLLSGTTILAETQDLTTGAGTWKTTTLTFQTGPSHPLFGQPLRIEFENMTESQLQLDRVEFSFAPVTQPSAPKIGTALANGTFEAGTPLGDWGFTPSVPGWQISVTDGAGTFNPADGSFTGSTDQSPIDPDTPIPSGRNIVYVHPGVTLFQDLPDLLLAGYRYEVSFSVGHRRDTPATGNYRVRLLAGGVEVASLSEALPAVDSWVQRSVPFIVPPNHAQLGLPLRVELVNLGPQQAVFDSVELSAVTDVRTEIAAMQNQNASVFVRIPFTVTQAAQAVFLGLQMRYDDGFVAWLNGTEIARRAAPATLAYNSAATSARTGNENWTREYIGLNQFLSLLREGQNILAVQGLNASAGDADFFLLPELVMTRMGPLREYFTEPTPGGPSRGDSWSSLVAPVIVSHASGYYDTAQSVSMTCASPSATIRYTLDGTEPTTSSAVFTSALNVNGNTILRAAAFLFGAKTSAVETRSYFFIASVLQQAADPLYPTWGGFPADYAMDTRIVNDPVWSQSIANDLRSLPVISIVMNPRDLFAAEGIYSNPAVTGDDSERRCAVEYFWPSGIAPGFHIDCGIRIQGDASRAHSESAKKSFRLAFRSEYGASKLDYPLFPNTRVTEFDTVRLKAHFGDGWTVPREHPKGAAFLRDQWARETQRLMGDPSPYDRSAFVYLNGKFWGLYTVMERPDADYCQSHFGGNESDYDVLSSGELVDGSWVAWQAMFDYAAGGLTDAARYQTFIDQHIDVDNFIDYMILNLYAYNQDWFGGLKNWYAIHSRAPGGKWQFISWDAEHTFSIVGINQPVDTDMVEDFDYPGTIMWLYHRLRQNPEFRVRFGDRLYRQCYNTGPLEPANLQGRWDALSPSIFAALVPESARWGDSKPPYTSPILTPPAWPAPLWQAPLTRNNVVEEDTRLRNQVFPTRRDAVITQFRRIQLYPTLDAPVFNQHGGFVAAGFQVTMSHGNAVGSIRYTTDNSDPRLAGGGVAPSAQTYTTPLTINNSTRIRARVYNPNNGEWSALLDAQFGGLLVTELHYHPTTFNTIDGDEFEFLELQNVGGVPLDLSAFRFSSAITYTFPPETVLQPGQFYVLASDAGDFATRYGLAADGEYPDQLSNGGETVTLVQPNNAVVISFTYGDAAPWPTAADGGGSSLHRANASLNHNLAGNWTAAAPSPRAEGALPPGVPALAAADTDGDRMPDEWESAHGLDPARADATQDSDGDGMNNLSEYLAGTNPNDPGSALRLAVEFLHGRVPAVQLRFTAAARASYRIESGLEPGDTTWATLTTVPAAEAARNVTLTFQIGPELGQFFRVIRQ